MAAIRTTVGVIFVGFAAALGAQTPGIGETRPSGPAKKEPPAHEAQKPPAASAHDPRRCEEFTGTLREDCLRDTRAAEGRSAGGATQRPEPPTAPPPNNPLGR